MSVKNSDQQQLKTPFSSTKRVNTESFIASRTSNHTPLKSRDKTTNINKRLNRKSMVFGSSDTISLNETDNTQNAHHDPLLGPAFGGESPIKNKTKSFKQ